MSKIVKIASLGEGNKSAYDAAGSRYFIPNRFRTTLTNGQYVLIVSKTFDSHMVDDKVVPCEPWTRDEIAVAGDFKTVVVAKNEPAILAGLEAAIVAAESKALAASFSPSDELKSAAAVAGK